ncbi:Uncharacterized protein Fot_13112 [Forsythia ovata]|uniref:Uncharacterized protein n=1 Tax=Forsythia ovata TaxID=205694 RepID=A0ABD1W2J6_9LAMI
MLGGFLTVFAVKWHSCLKETIVGDQLGSEMVETTEDIISEDDGLYFSLINLTLLKIDSTVQESLSSSSSYKEPRKVIISSKFSAESLSHFTTVQNIMLKIKNMKIRVPEKDNEKLENVNKVDAHSMNNRNTSSQTNFMTKLRLM